MSSTNQPAARNQQQDTGIATPWRFLYLNFYAWLLLALALAAVLVPLWRRSLWFLLLQLPVAFVCLKGGMGILSGWPDKKKKYAILMERNSVALRPDTFAVYAKAPCGRLLIRVVLADLGHAREYRALLRGLPRPTLRDRLREACPRRATTIYVNTNYRPEERKR